MGKEIVVSPIDKSHKSFNYNAMDKSKIWELASSSGFISPEGNFYNVYDYNGDLLDKAFVNNAHGLFVEKYCEEVLGTKLIDIINESDASIEKLGGYSIIYFVNYMGWIYYKFIQPSICPQLVTPSSYYNGKTITKQQLQLLLDIWENGRFDIARLESKVPELTKNKVKVLMRDRPFEEFGGKEYND